MGDQHSNSDRAQQIAAALPALRAAWPALTAEINRIVAGRIDSLIIQDNPETRGRIKALRDLLDLPRQLQDEHEALTAELPDSDSAL